MDVDNHQRGPLHLAVEGDFATILSVLLEHGANPDTVDENRNNGNVHVYGEGDWVGGALL